MASATVTKCRNGFWRAKLTTAPTIARTEAIGKMVPARWFHKLSRTSAVENWVPVSKLLIRVNVAGTAKRNMAERIDSSGLLPAAVSRIARTTKNAASVGMMRATTKLDTKFWRSAWRLASQGELMVVPVPAGKLVLMPNEEN